MADGRGPVPSRVGGRALPLRVLLVALGLASLAYVAIVAVQVVSVLRPAAAELSGRTRFLLTDHDAIAAGLEELRSARREVALLVPPFTHDVAQPDADSLRERVRLLLDAGANIRASVDRADLPMAMRQLLAQAQEQVTGIGVDLVEALRAVELGRPDRAVDALRASGVRSDSTTVLLSAAQRLAMADLLQREQRLLGRLRSLDHWALAWAVIGGAFFLFGAWLVGQRVYRPVRQMEAAVRRVTAGDLDAEVEVARLDELGRLAMHLNAMTAMLRERALEESRRRENIGERFGRILDESSNEICVFDADTLRVVLANRGARINLGYDRDEIAALTMPSLLSEMGPESLASALNRLRRGGQPRLLLSTRQTRRDGTTYPVEMSIQYSTDGDSAVFVTVAEDASARQRVRELDNRVRDFALAEQRVLAGGDLRAALRLITAMTADAMHATRCGVVREDAARIRCLDMFDARDGTHHESTEANTGEWTLDDGRLEAPVHVAGQHTATVVVEQLGEERVWTAEERTFVEAVADLVARALEAAERRSLERQLARAQRMDSIGQLAGGVAHDFNNLLTAILGNLEMSRADLTPGAPLDVSLAEAEHAARRAAELTRQLLTFARHQVVESRVVDVNALTREADRMLRRLIGASIELRTQLADDLRPVRIGPGQFEQVVMNLVVNARDAMPDGGMITIQTRNVTLDGSYAADHPDVSPGEFVELSVTDTGAGMDRRTLDRVFEPFYTTKALGEGTGLGLAVCYGIVRQAGGTIAVESEPGLGSRFRVCLPVAKEALDTDGAVQHAPAHGHETVLLVEDERAIRQLLERALTKRGYNVLTASDGKDALVVADEAQGRFDLLISDVIMPRMGGPELVRRLRERRPALRALLISGYTAEAVPDIDELGVAFLAKPFTPDELCARARSVLDGEAAGGRPSPTSGANGNGARGAHEPPLGRRGGRP
ncbi:MAG TPA: ATP-binding protein [Gemmatimonadaceae bacterium]|nr:ATP-binding protein [Gemmatimonadaceae bacterium]